MGRTHAPAGWLADGPRRAQTVLALREPDPSGSMGFLVSRARAWVRCGIQPMARSDMLAAKRTVTCEAGQDEPNGSEALARRGPRRLRPRVTRYLPMRELHGNPSKPLR